VFCQSWIAVGLMLKSYGEGLTSYSGWMCVGVPFDLCGMHFLDVGYMLD